MPDRSTSTSPDTPDQYIRPYTDIEGNVIETAWMPSSAKEAKAKGETLYWTGKPCLRGHTAPRYASSGLCVRCNREWDRTPERREKCRERNRRWYRANREHVAERMREYYEENADRYAAHYGKAAAEKRVPGCTPADYDIAAVIPIYATARHTTEETGVQHHVDHAIPLVLGGQHVASNLRVVTAEENAAKSVIERQLVAAATGADPIERTKAVWRDIRDGLAELVGADLAGRIHRAAMEVAEGTARSRRRSA